MDEKEPISQEVKEPEVVASSKEPKMKLEDVSMSPKRLEGEDFEVYKMRRKLINKLYEIKKKGNLIQEPKAKVKNV